MQADALAGITALFPMEESMLLPIYVQAIPTITESHICNTVNEEQEWTINIKAFLWARTLPEDPKHTHKIGVQAACFTLIRDDLYRWSFGSSYLRCLTQLKIQYMLSELHEGICGNHSGGRTLAHRAHSQGYYCYHPCPPPDVAHRKAWVKVLESMWYMKAIPLNL